MTMHSDKHLNSCSNPTKQGLSIVLPEGRVVNRNWLKQKGFKRPLVDYYLRTGALVAVTRGVYRRPGPPLKWQHVVFSLQELGLSVHVGGRSALDHQGLAHYLPLRSETIHLYSPVNLPAWLHKVEVNAPFKTHHHALFTVKADTLGYNTVPFGAWDWPLNYSSKERALLEYLDSLPQNAPFDMPDKYMESAVALRPDLLMGLLQACKRIKTKRLFLWFAERHHHSWFARLDISSLDLGSGKRVIYKGGVLNKKYNITVPSEYENGGAADGTERPLF